MAKKRTKIGYKKKLNRKYLKSRSKIDNLRVIRIKRTTVKPINVRKIGVKNRPIKTKMKTQTKTNSKCLL